MMNCGALGAIPGAGCPALESGDFASLSFQGSAEVQGQLKGFLEAVYNLDKLALEMETGLIASCGELGAELDMAEAEITAEPSGGEGAKKVCGAVAAKISEMLKANAEASLSIEIGEPKCQADIEALTDCFADCGATISPGEFEASCEGGEISGTCEGECSGSCTVEAGAECSGKCGGKCEGKCDGECSVQNDDGSCAGQCDGTCEGTCSASCTMDAQADCKGTCSGGCDVEMKAPKCSGEFKPPSVSADCQMNCTAKTAAAVSCDPPSVDIKVDGEANADIEKLVAALQVALPKIVNIQLGMGQRMVGVAKGLVEAGASLPQVASSAGLQAIGCIAMAAEMAVSASASVSVNVEASASVGGAASGEAG